MLNLITKYIHLTRKRIYPELMMSKNAKEMVAIEVNRLFEDVLRCLQVHKSSISLCQLHNCMIDVFPEKTNSRIRKFIKERLVIDMHTNDTNVMDMNLKHIKAHVSKKNSKCSIGKDVQIALACIIIYLCEETLDFIGKKVKQDGKVLITPKYVYIVFKTDMDHLFDHITLITLKRYCKDKALLHDTLDCVKKYSLKHLKYLKQH